METLFRHEAEEGRRVLEVVKLDGDEFERIVWRAEHSMVEFAPADKRFLLWKASGKVTARALRVLVGKGEHFGKALAEQDVVAFRTSGVLGVPEQRGKRSIFPLSWGNIPVRDLRGMFLRVLWGRHPSLPKDLGNFYFVPPLTLPRSRTYTSTAPTRAIRTELWVYPTQGSPEVPEATVCQKVQTSGGDCLPSPTRPGGF